MHNGVARLLRGIVQVVTQRLPRLNKEKAGAVVFLGHNPKGAKCNDVAANPEVLYAL